MKLFAGVDIGSTTSKCIIIDESGSVLTFQVLYTEFDRNLSGEKVLKAAMDAIGVTEQDIAYIISTGYGRKAFLKANDNIPEIIFCKFIFN